MKYKNGLVIGKFLPPHKGHEYLIRFAKECCEQLTVIVDCVDGQIIAPEIRKMWLEEVIHGIKVIALKDNMPQAPEEHSDFWNIWKNKIEEVSGKNDVLIASEHYGFNLAHVLNCDFIQCDINRYSIDISATTLKQNIYQHWDMLLPSARNHFMKKICLIGPESTGKSTIAKELSTKYNTIYVPEYAETLLKSQNGILYDHNMLEIAHIQKNKEKSLSYMTNKFMFCDSDCITTLVWANHLFNRQHTEIEFIAEHEHYDITFLLYPDTKWVFDEHRNLDSNSSSDIFRLTMFKQMESYLHKYNRNYQIIHGNFIHKKEQIINYVDGLL